MTRTPEQRKGNGVSLYIIHYTNKTQLFQPYLIYFMPILYFRTLVQCFCALEYGVLHFHKL